MTLNLDTSDIVSMAFMAMEKTPPASFSDDSEEAALTEKHYPTALQSCLEECDWSDASVWANLPQITPGPTVGADPELPYLFQLPGDCVKGRQVGDGFTKWRIDKEGLRADCPAPLSLRYTSRDISEARMPSSFREAVSLKLAILLAPKFLGTSGKIEALKRDFQDVLKNAQRKDSRTASEARYDGLPDEGDWVTEARR